MPGWSLCDCFREDVAHRIADLWNAAAAPRPLPIVRRVSFDGLAWCAECRRAVDRGWQHSRRCKIGAGEAWAYRGRPGKFPGGGGLTTRVQRVLAGRSPAVGGSQRDTT